MKVNICGILHEVKECEDHFNLDLHCGQINFGSCEIRINSGLNPKLLKNKGKKLWTFKKMIL